MSIKNDLPYWVALNHVPGIGSVTFRQLLEYFGSIQQAWQASQTNLHAAGLGPKLTQTLLSSRETIEPELLFKKIVQSGIAVAIFTSPEYPARLKEIYDPPPVLYIRGQLSPEDEQAIAVVGARKMTSYGKQATTKLVSELVEQNLTIVSGLARGVDGCAHQAALNAGGRTIAVLGSGVNNIYPTEHTHLAKQIIEKHGAVISEFPPDFPAVPGNFPARNRIISGLSLGILVTEAAEKSGTMITVGTALEQGREVFAVPGPITSLLSVGTMKLIREGAKLVTSAEDILEEFAMPLTIGKSNTIYDPSPEEALVLQTIENEPKHLDVIVRETGLATSSALAMLTTMELSGVVQNLGNGLWSTN